MDEESTNPCVVFLNEDLDTIPERHAFLGNYRRFCSSIVESITKRRPFEAFAYIMANVDNTLSSLYSTEPAFDRKFILIDLWHCTFNDAPQLIGIRRILFLTSVWILNSPWSRPHSRAT